MHKTVIHRPGSYDRLCWETLPGPIAGPHDVIVDTVAVGVNYADVVVRMGLYESAKKYVGWPITPGFEFTGRVTEVGSEVRDLELGTEVMGVTRFGAYATRVAVPRQHLFALPRGFDTRQAAGFPTVFLTAYHALFNLAHVREGETLLVHSAAGGVGAALVQLARIARCRCIGVVGGAHKVGSVNALGADVVIDKSSEALWPTVERNAPQGCDVVLDGNGVATLRESYRHLAPSGRLITYGFHSMFPKRGGKPNWLKLARDFLMTPRFHPLQLTNDNKSVLAFNLSFLFHRQDLLDQAMTRLLRWAEDGLLKPLEMTTYPLADAARAHRDLESAQTVGKLVLLTHR